MSKTNSSVRQAQQCEPEGIALIWLYVRFTLEILGLLLYTVYSILAFVYRRFIPAEPKSLKNEIILVTGGGNGVGRELCLQLARAEKNLTIISWDVDEASNESTVAELKALGVHKAVGFKVDISNQAEVESTAVQIRQDIGDVSILFNNAGILGPLGISWEMNPAGVQKTYDINVISHCWTLREFLPAMIAKGRGGHVVETCSAVGFIYGKHGAPYISSKYAVIGYIESVKEDLRHLQSKPDVKISLVYPHHIHTKLTANINFGSRKYPFMVPYFTAEFVASKIIEGMRRNEEHIYVPGGLRAVNMFIQLLPSPVVRRMIDIIGIQHDS